jgi:hypothetical protein
VLTPRLVRTLSVWLHHTADQDDDVKVQLSRARSALYQQVLGTIFKRTIEVSKTGFIVNCGNKVTQNVYPGLLILSLDMQEVLDNHG